MRYKWLLHKFMQHRIVFRSNLSAYPKFTSTNRIMCTNTKSLEHSKAMLKDMFLASIKAAAPDEIVRNKIKYQDGILQVDDKSFELKKNVYLVGFGKAVMDMALVFEYMLGDRLKKGIVSVPAVSTDAMWEAKDKSFFPKLGTGVIEYRPGSKDNQPDSRSLDTTHDIIDLVEPLTEDDTLIVLISGGGSALLYMPRPVIDQEDKSQLCKKLQNAGAEIKELNTVRSKLSMVKGGGLARMAYPASIISLILSDIVGDPIELIASGPTVYNSKAPDEVVAILKKYNLLTSIEADLKSVLTSKERFNDAPLINKDKQFTHVNNILLGNNMVAIEAAKMEALRKKLNPIILRNDVTGDVHDVSLAYVHITNLICLALDNTLEREEFFEQVKDIPVLSLPATKVDEIYNLIENIKGEGVVLIGGGEPTVVVKGDGKGGRNQELALHFSLDWLSKIKSNPRLSEYDVIMLSVGTDGQDGPTDAAGAYGYPAIGPLMHDLYMQIKGLTAKEITKENAKKEASVKKAEETEVKCKLQELSGFLKAKKSDTEPEPPIIPVEPDSSDEEDKNKDRDYVNPLILQTMEVERMLPENTLANNDTYNFYSRFKKGTDLIKTGFTGTNVMDLHFIHIRKRKCDCKIDYTEEDKFENTLDTHDLYIDPSTLEKYWGLRAPLTLQLDKRWHKPSLFLVDKADHLNIKIIDDNLNDPCCRKIRKFPVKNMLKEMKIEL